MRMTPPNIPYLHDKPELLRLKSLRREFHAYPETAWTEFRTTARICDLLEDMGYELIYGKELDDGKPRFGLPSYKEDKEAYDAAAEMLGSEERICNMRDGNTGVIARMRCGPGPKLGFRFDMDGLPIMESGEEGHLPTNEGFASRNKNMHACGHDGHIAIGLGLAKRIADNRKSLKGDYYLIFQPAEEGGLGGQVFSRNGALDGLDRFVAIHVGIVPERKLVCCLSFLAMKKCNVIFMGRSAHAAIAPHEGKNALLAATTAVNAIYAIPPHEKGESRVGVGQFHSSNAPNVISDRALLDVEVRGEDNEICEDMVERVMEILREAAKTHKVKLNVEDNGYTIRAPSSPRLCARIRKAALKVGIPEEAIIDERLALGSEDAPFMMEAVQKGGGEAAYICLGCSTRGGHHNPDFDFDEDLLLWGVEMLWKLVEKKKKKKSGSKKQS